MLWLSSDRSGKFTTALMDILPLTVIGIILISALPLATIILAFCSNLLRDEISDPWLFLDSARKSKKFRHFLRERKAKIPRPFSLARTQLALWTNVIGCSYVYLVFCKYPGSPLNIDATSLALLSISVGTTAGGMAIDTSQREKFRHQNEPSRSFLIDILSDTNGVSIARFQQFVWTIIAAVLYVSQLEDLPSCRLPSLNNALLGLTGVSCAAYLTVKAGENAGNGANMALSNAILNGDSRAVTQIPQTTTILNKGGNRQPF